jgi:subtilisin family serine protease
MRGVANHGGRPFVSDVLKLKYGGTALDLRKSEHFTAVRSDVVRRLSRDNSLSGASSDQITEHPRTGDFAVLKTETAKKLTDDGSQIEKSAKRGTLANVYHSSDDMVAFIPTGTIYLEFRDDVPESAKTNLRARYSLTWVSTGRDGALTLRVAGGEKDAVETCAALQLEPIVKIAEPDLATEGEVKGFALPDDAFFGRQWHLENSGTVEGDANGLKAGADARVVGAWRLMQGFGSPDVVIAIIDDGFDLTHPDLSDRIVHAWDFKRNTSNVAPEPNLNSPTTGDWHGTACAGVAIAALHAGNVVGAAPGCSWMPVRWSALEPVEVVKWFDHVRENGAWVISCSWGPRAKNYPLPTRIAKAIEQCARQGRNGKGCIIVFAAGNEGRDVNDPASGSVHGFAIHPDVIAVAASTSLDDHPSYSNFGEAIWICAPSSGGGGRDITTADATGEFLDAIGTPRPMGYVPGDYHEHFGKTSSACPLVAGICGLILSANPTLSAAAVRELLKNTARRIGDPDLYDANGHSKLYGYGCINAETAVAEARALLPSV